MSRADRRADALSADQIRELDALDRVLAGVPAGALDREHAPLVALVAAVRDDRGPVRPAFADELGRRVASGFARDRGARQPGSPGFGGHRDARARLRVASFRRPSRRQWLAGLGAAASVAVGVVAITAGVGSRPSSGAPVLSAPTSSAQAQPALRASANPANPANQQSPANAVAGSAAGGVASSPSIAPPSPAPATLGTPRAVESDASLELLAPRGQVQQVADKAIAATDRLGGIVASSNVTLGDQGGSQATLALVVPSAALDRTLAAISSLAHVSARSQDTLDITDPTRAARDRLGESRAERLALLRQLGRATRSDQVVSIRAQLGLVAGRITQDEASLQALVNHASTASVNVTIDEAGRSAVVGGGPGWAPTAALGTALSVLEVAFAVLVIALAVLGPAGVLGGLVWYSARAVRRRRREAALAG